MKLRRLVYCFMSDKFLGRRVNLNSKRLDMAEDSKTRLEIIDENNDILIALVHKHRDDKEFVKMVHDGVQNLLDKYKGV